MSFIQYDPDNWLLSLTRSLGDYVTQKINDPDVSVEMSFPDTKNWTKQTPLDKAVIHFEQDDLRSPRLGFGIPGVDVIDDVAGTVIRQEAVQRIFNFDVGVWVSAEMGGATKRMELVQKLADILGSTTGQQEMYQATNGLNVLSFDGGANQLDRVNDIPLWREMGMTLVLRVFSRTNPLNAETLIDAYTQDEELVIADNGVLRPATTP